MDLNDLNKRQLILLTLLITFIVSIATGIVTVSLMNQMPKVVPQTINNVIQRTIERVTTVTENAPIKTDIEDNKKDNNFSYLGDGDAIVSIYNIDSTPSNITEINSSEENNINLESTLEDKDEIVLDNKTDSIGEGVIISDVGLILVDSNILNNGDTYKVILNDLEFKASILKKFSSITILKIVSENESNSEKDKLEIDQNNKNN